MGRVIQQIINQFDLGITNEPREANARYCQMVKNFDIHSFKNKLVPFRSTESGDDGTNHDASTRVASEYIRNFCIAKRSSTEYNLYGLAKRADGTSDLNQIFYKTIAVSGTAFDLDGASWNTSHSNNKGTTGTTGEFDLFVYYERVDKIFGSRDSRYLWSYEPDDGGFVDAAADLTSYTTIRQGLVHSKDDILYIPYDNKIAKNNNGSWTAVALTLPVHLKINSICEYGNYIAIGAAPKSGFGKSIVYLWDRDSSLTTLSESIDWGDGELFALEEIDGVLVGISNVGKSGAPATYSNGPTTAQRIVFRYLSGNKAILFNQLISQSSTSFLTTISKKYKHNNYLYFVLFMTFPDGTLREGIWKLGKSQSGNFAVALELTPNNDTPTTSLGTFLGFIRVGDFILMSYTDSGVITVRKTIEKSGTSEFAQTSQYDTVILNDGDSSITKKLLGVTLFTEPIPSGGAVTIKYKIDAETSFTTIFTHSTANSLSHSAINIESSAANLPQYKEITFSLVSTGGAVITGAKYKSEIIDKDVY